MKKFVSVIVIAAVVFLKGVTMVEAHEKKDIKLCIEGNKIPVKVQLYRDGKKFGKEVNLKKSSKHTWKNIKLEDKNGKAYKFSVKEVGDEYGWIEVDGRVFTTEYKGNIETGFKIENKEQLKNVPEETELAK